MCEKEGVLRERPRISYLSSFAQAKFLSEYVCALAYVSLETCPKVLMDGISKTHHTPCFEESLSWARNCQIASRMAHLLEAQLVRYEALRNKDVTSTALSYIAYEG